MQEQLPRSSKKACLYDGLFFADFHHFFHSDTRIDWIILISLQHNWWVFYVFTQLLG